MNTIAATNSSASDSLLALLRLISEGTDAASSASSAAGTTPSSRATAKNSLGPTTLINLSDDAKAVLARAKSDQAAAAQLRSFGEAHRVESNGDADSVGKAPASVGAGNPSLGNFSAQDGTIYGLIVTPTGPSSDVATFVPTVEPKISFSSQLQAGGFSISATGDASTGTYSMEIDGPDGFHWSNQKLDPTPRLGFVSWRVPAGGFIMSGAGPGNIETITFSEDSVTAANVTDSTGARMLDRR